MYIAKFKSQSVDKAYSQLSFEDALNVLNELIAASTEPVEEALILNNPDFTVHGFEICELVASPRTVR